MNTKLPQGWFHDKDIEMYRMLAEQVPDYGMIIELGVWKGKSLCSIADIIKKKNLIVYAVDTFKGTTGKKEHKEAEEVDLQKVFTDNLNNFGIKAEVYKMTTDEASKIINDKFDLIFIDADHTEEAVKKDIENWLPKCKGFIAGHDYEKPWIKKIVDKKFPNRKYIHGITDPGRGTMWWNNCKLKNPMTNKKIDIIIPAFRAQNTILRTLSSIAMQSILDKLTVTIVNDADGDYKVFVDMFKDVMDIKEIKLEVNGGPGVARQFGIDNTTSPYFTCIDADDTFASAFSLETLLKGVETNPGYHTIVGSFIEQHEHLQFVMHQNDLVWMFGKLYTREFIDKYKIRFNKTRANEDNGFNTIIRLVSSETEKIMFLPDVVYFWHHKEDSITRINNNQYSYDQSFIGYTDNMIYAIKEAKKVKPFNNYVDMWAIQVMCQLYLYYHQTIKRDPRFTEQNFSHCVKYYKEVFKQYDETMTHDNFAQIFSETISEQAPNNKDVLPEKTIYQFIEELKKS